jgi:hypothetical protein
MIRQILSFLTVSSLIVAGNIAHAGLVTFETDPLNVSVASFVSLQDATVTFSSTEGNTLFVFQSDAGNGNGTRTLRTSTDSAGLMSLSFTSLQNSISLDFGNLQGLAGAANVRMQVFNGALLTGEQTIASGLLPASGMVNLSVSSVLFDRAEVGFVTGGGAVFSRIKNIDNVSFSAVP